MKGFTLVAITVAIVALAVFFKSDCDLFLFFSKIPNPQSAFDANVVWITGASSGIGAALAKELTKAGAQVVISARRVEQLEQVAAECVGGKKPMVVPLDVTDLQSHQEAYDKIVQEFGRVDMLVLNAGRSQRNPAVETPFDVTKSIMELNFLSVVHLAKVVLPSMVARKSGHLVLMSSLSGRMGTPLASSYSASKYAMHGYFDALRSEVAGDNITVSIVCPGPVESEIHLTTYRKQDTPPAPEGKKMSTLRCIELVMRGLYYKVDEMWISDQPFLFFTYLNVYFPWVSRQLFKVVGPLRVKILKEGGNIYDVKNIIFNMKK